jgi:hypothetical protein
MKKVIVIGLLSLGLTVSGFQSAFANTNEAENTNTIETEATLNGQAEDSNQEELNSGTGTVDDEEDKEITEDDTTVIDGEDDKSDTPSLVPGDFFYFVKIMIEKVRLAVTLNDHKEAQLLAQFTSERIDEANALLLEGKTEEATELLQKAIEIQEEAEELTDGVTVTTGDGTEVTVKLKDLDGQDEPVTTEEDTQLEDDVQEKDDDEEITELRGKLANNIDALLLALSKVENPKAQAALMKNIQKSFAKLDSKIAKLEDKANRKSDVEVEENEEQLQDQEEITDEKKTIEAKVIANESVDRELAKKQEKETVKEAKEKAKEEKENAKKAMKEKKEKGNENKGNGKNRAKETKNNASNKRGNQE